MLKGNLIDTFKTFTPKEMREFGEFINSPYFIKNKKVKKLYDVLKKYYPKFDSSKLEKQKVFRMIYGGESYKDSKLRILMFYLYEIVEKFLAHNRIANKEIAFKENVVKELLERNLYKDFEKTNRQELIKLDKRVNINEEYYLNKFTFEYEYFSYLSKIQTQQYDKFMKKENIEKVFSNLTYYYFIKIFKFYCVVLNTQTLFNTTAETGLFEKILSVFDADLFKEAPLVNIYYNAVMCLLRPDEEKYYYSLKNLVFERKYDINSDDLLDLYINLENYCIRKIRAGNTVFFNENFEILKKEIDLRIFYKGEFMSPSFYRSAVVVGTELKESEWVKNFIEKYRAELDEQYMDPVYYYCLAYIQETEGNYEKGLDYLARAKTDELYLKIEIKLLQCKLFYMLNWNIHLSSLIDTFKRTLNNNKLIPENRKALYLKFIKYLNKLNNLKDDKDPAKIGEIKSEIINDEAFMQKSWLLKRADEAL